MNIIKQLLKFVILDVKSSTYIDFDVKNNDEVFKFEVSDQVRISKYKKILQNFPLQIGHKKFLLLKRLKILYHKHM